MPNASITARQMKNSRLVSKRITNGKFSDEEEPVVDGELHDGVAVETRPEDLPPLLLRLLCLLCG